MNPIAAELSTTELFRNVPEATIHLALAHAAPVTLEAGAVLLSPERENHHIYLLLSGTLGVHFGAPDSPEIRELRRGVSVGEMSVIDGTPPSAYVIAKERCRLFPVHRDLLQQLIDDTSPVAGNLLRLMTTWMKANTQRIVQDRLLIWELTDHANVDALTRLYNRRWLDNAFERLLAQATQGEHPLGVLLVDVDHFKRYNDNCGHLSGDRALIAMGEVLKTSVRPYDFAVRYGGEEFLVILPNTDLDAAIFAAERIRLTAEKKTIKTPEGAALPGITVSIGIATNAPGSTPSNLIAAADAQLYRAKNGGRNCVSY